MTPLVIRHELDPTGSSPDNFVQGEPHTLLNRRYRAVAAKYGAFYAESLVIRDVTNNAVLTSSQYYAGEQYEQPTLQFGKLICSVIVITDESVGPLIEMDYQALGGPYGDSADAIITLYNQIMLDDRPVSWEQIVNKPDAFPPAPHLHDAGDIYGFEYLVYAIDRVRDAILMGDQLSHNEIYAYIDNLMLTVNQRLDDLESITGTLVAHLTDYGNPHNVTAAQTGAYTRAEVDDLLVKFQRPAFRAFVAGSL